MSVRTLVLCDDTWHPAAIARRGLEPLRRQGFEFEFLEDGAAWTAKHMNEFALTVLAKANITSSRAAAPWLDAESQHEFSDCVRRGRGLVAVHSGTSRYEELPAMKALIGGAFVRHPDQCAVTIEPTGPHALAAGAEPFTVRDEHYFMSPVDAQAKIFLRSRSEHGEQPAGWARAEGAGRVCVLTPGHNAAVWRHPSFQRLLLNALRWTAKMN